MFKKLIYAPLFLFSLAAFFYLLLPILQNPMLVLSIELKVLIQMIILASFALLSALFMAIFINLSMETKIIAPVLLIAILIPLIIIPFYPANLFIVLGLLVSFVLQAMMLTDKLRNYITFQPTVLLGPTVRATAVLILLSSTLGFYQVVNTNLQEKGFTIPDELLDATLSLMPQTELPKLSLEEYQVLKSNPQLRERSQVSAEMLDLMNPSNPNPDLKSYAKSQIKPQLEAQLKPYQPFIPYILAVIFFLTLQFVVSFLGLLTIPIIALLFYLMEQAGLVKYVKEMREVKKLVV